MRDEFGIAVGSLDARGTGLGGWELDIHHAYDARMRTLYRGDGPEISAEPVLDTLADTGHAGDPRDADVAPDGRSGSPTPRPTRSSASTARPPRGDGGLRRRRRRLRELQGQADNATTEDDPLAKGFPLARPMSVALAPDGGFYIADYLFDWAASSRASSTASTRRAGSTRSPAACATCWVTAARRRRASMTPLDLAVGSDGTLYLADYRNARIRAIDADGTIRTVAGGGAGGGGYDDGITAPRAPVPPQSVEAGPDG